MEEVVCSYMLMNKEEHNNYTFNNKLEHCKWYDPAKLDYLIIPKDPDKEELPLSTISYQSCIQNKDLEGLQQWYIENRSAVPFMDRLSYYLARNDLKDPIKKYELNEIKKISKKNRQIDNIRKEEERKALKKVLKEQGQRLRVIKKECILHF
tara:strand:- start:2650 stop:3105 length:456 start_codon:yes stop_codon:yes gene_type:complete